MGEDQVRNDVLEEAALAADAQVEKDKKFADDFAKYKYEILLDKALLCVTTGKAIAASIRALKDVRGEPAMSTRLTSFAVERYVSNTRDELQFASPSLANLAADSPAEFAKEIDALAKHFGIDIGVRALLERCANPPQIRGLFYAANDCRRATFGTNDVAKRVADDLETSFLAAASRLACGETMHPTSETMARP